MSVPHIHRDLDGVRRWTSVGDCYAITKKPRGLTLSSFSSIPFLPMKAIPNSGTYVPPIVCRHPKDIASGRYFEQNDVIVACITPSFENGKQCIAFNLPAAYGIATTEIIPLHPRDSTQDRRFLFFYLLHPTIRQYMTQLMEGSTGRQRIPQNVLLDLPYPVLSLEDQRAICKMLELVQSMKAVNNDAEQVSRTLRFRTSRALFGHGWWPGQAREEVIGLIPEAWATDRLGNHFEIAQGCSVSGNIATGKEGVPFLRTSNVRWGHIDLSTVSRMYIADGKTVPVLRDGDLLVCEGGEIGRAAMWSDQIHHCTYQNHIYRLRPSGGNEVDARFLMRWLEEGFVGRKVYGGVGNRTTIANLSQSRLANLTIPVPPARVQRRIVDILDGIDQKIDYHVKRQVVVDELFQALLHALLTGEISAEAVTRSPSMLDGLECQGE